MSDIDFDELDKAVNSLVGDKNGPQEKLSDVKPDTTAPSAEPEVSKPNNPISSSLPSTRAGRFMDVKHTSSDMKSDANMMNKTETNIAPLNSDQVKADMQKDAPPSPTPIAAPAESQKDKDAANSDEKMDNTKSELNFEETEPKRDEDDKKEKEGQATGVSPFIDDAKVEKRPLGGFSTDSSVMPSSEGKNEDQEGEDKDATPEEPEVPIELPPELDKELVAIEAGESPDSIKSPDEIKDDNKNSEESDSETTDIESEKKDDKPGKDAPSDADNTASPTDHKERVAELLASASSGSIPEQYKRENRSHELQHDAHPLFDADHFKASPSTVKKPKSTAAKIFQWIFIGVGLLLLGASIGAAVFVFMSQS